MSSEGKIFNVEEPTGKQQAESETTAATARVDAPTSSAAREVDKAAEGVQEAAEHVASIANEKGPGFTGDPTSAVDQLQKDMKEVKDSAVSEGKHDVQQAFNSSKAATGNADSVEKGQSYLGSDGSQSAFTGVTSQIQASAVAAAGTAKEYLSSAQQAAQPHIDKAKEVASSYLGGSSTGQPGGKAPGSSTGV